MIAAPDALIGVNSLETADPAHLLVRERWRALSVRTIWLRAGDWFHPAVDALVAALASSQGVLDAVEALGVARAEHGVGVGEAIDDLACLYEAAEAGTPPLEAVRALCEGWASPAGAPLVPGTCLDPESGLPTAEYLSVRLTEEFTQVRRRGRSPAQDLCFIYVDVARDGVAPWNRLARSAAVGRAIEVAFGVGHPSASLGSGVFAILHPAGTPVADAVARLSKQVDVQGEELGVADVLRQPPRIWIEAMPDEHHEAVALLTTRRSSGEPAAGPSAPGLLERSPFGPRGLPPFSPLSRPFAPPHEPGLPPRSTLPPFSPEPLSPPNPRPSPEA